MAVFILAIAAITADKYDYQTGQEMISIRIASQALRSRWKEKVSGWLRYQKIFDDGKR